MELYFLYPKLLLLLFLIPLFIFIYYFGIIFNKKKSMVFGNFEAMQRFYDVEFFSKNFIALYINIAILILLIFAVSGTVISYEAETSSFSYVVAIDNSGSMRADDFSPNRFEAAKESAKRFIDLLPKGVKVGVISFSGDAQILQDVDVSKLKAKLAIDRADFGNIEGTNVYNALISANRMFEDDKLKSVVLISDGQFNIGDTPQILDYAKDNNIVVNSISIGTSEGGVTNTETVSRVDEDFLKSISFESEGKFFRVGDLVDLDESFTYIAEDFEQEVSIDFSFYLLLGAIVLFFINWVLYNLKLKTIP